MCVNYVCVGGGIVRPCRPANPSATILKPRVVIFLGNKQILPNGFIGFINANVDSLMSEVAELTFTYYKSKQAIKK